jgi:hypothetical protein
MTMVKRIQIHLDKLGYTERLHTKLSEYMLQAQAAARAKPPLARPPPTPLDVDTLPNWDNCRVCKIWWQGRELTVTRDWVTRTNWVQPLGPPRWWNIDMGRWQTRSPEDADALQSELLWRRIVADMDHAGENSMQLLQQLQQHRATELPSSSGASSSQHPRPPPAAAFPDHHPPTEPLPNQGVWVEPVSEEPDPADYGEAPMTPEDGAFYSGGPPSP